jgi:hypothetical protein
VTLCVTHFTYRGQTLILGNWEYDVFVLKYFELLWFTKYFLFCRRFETVVSSIMAGQ